MLDLVAGVWSNDSSKQLHSTIKLREILSLESPNPRIDQVIESGVVPRLLEFMQRDYDPSLQDEAAWVVAIIASGTVEHTKAVVDLGALPIFLQLLGDSSVDDVRAKAIWALGSVAATSVMYRDLVLHSGALLRILPWVCLSSDLPILRDAAWTIARLCGGQPQAPFEKLAPALPGLELLVRLNDEETTEQACIALYHLSSSCRGIQIQSIIETGVVPKLVALLMDSSSSVVALALDIVGNIVTGDTQQTQCVIHCGALPHLANLLTQNHMESIKMNACKTVSRITAGTEEQIQSVIDANLIPPLVNLAQNAVFETKKRAVWAISNAISGGSHNQIKYLVEQNCIKPLCDLLVYSDSGIITYCLDGLENILRAGEAEKKKPGDVNYYSQLIIDAEGKEKIRNLHRHKDHEIRVFRILKTYCRLLREV